MSVKIRNLTVLIVLFSNISFAVDKPEVEIVPLKNLRAIIGISQTLDSKIEVSVISSGGEIVYYWESKNPINSFRKIFDFTNLLEGEYNLVVNSNGNRKNSRLYITAKEITVEPVQQLFEPYFKYESDRLKLSFLNIAQKSVSLSVYDKNGLVTTVKLGSDMSIQKYFDISSLYEGEYDIVLNDYFAKHHFKIVK